ncbi:MAG: hypothetical protein ACRDMY_06715 [Gaiellaceae bacterium]
MLAGLRAHARANLVAYLALFFALSGTGAYASHLVVRSSDIVNGGVRAVDLRNGAVTRQKLAANAVNGPKIATNAVGGTEIATGAVGETEIAADAVGGVEIAEDAVSYKEIAANGVTGTEIAPGAVGPGHHSAVPHGRALQTVSQTFASVTQTRVHLDTLQFGSDMTVAGNALVVGVPGVYFVSATIDWAVNGTGGRSLSVVRNGSSLGATDQVQAVPATFGNTLQSVGVLARFAAGDEIELFAAQGSGGSLATAVVGGNGANLSAVWIGP